MGNWEKSVCERERESEHFQSDFLPRFPSVKSSHSIPFVRQILQEPQVDEDFFEWILSKNWASRAL